MDPIRAKVRILHEDVRTAAVSIIVFTLARSLGRFAVRIHILILVSVIRDRFRA